KTFLHQQVPIIYLETGPFAEPSMDDKKTNTDGEKSPAKDHTELRSRAGTQGHLTCNVILSIATLYCMPLNIERHRKKLRESKAKHQPEALDKEDKASRSGPDAPSVTWSPQQ
ncbi:hypothetical protein JEQ12_000441, partial [Ovis aries]